MIGLSFLLLWMCILKNGISFTKIINKIANLTDNFFLWHTSLLNTNAQSSFDDL